MKRLAKLIDGGLRMLDQERMVRASGFFDADWYIRTYPEAGEARGALSYFLQTGTALRHDPGPNFSTAAYLAANPDVREAGCNALVHYLRFGRDEGRGGATGTGETRKPLGPEAMARIREAFDPVFYAATNPDLSSDTDLLAHFMGVGWTERRDPCDWFSVEYYLGAHPDLADTGQNPFVHYLIWGCREARTIRPSRKPRYARLKVGDSARPRLAALSMVKNEADIIRAFAGHVLALFDDVVFVDHMSTDGTHEYLEELASTNRRVHVLRLVESAYLQSLAMTHAVREMEVLRTADWVFPLDVDEFLPFATRNDFESALGQYADCPVISMRWQNLVPKSYWSGTVDITGATEFVVPPELSPYRKVAFQPKRVSLGRAVVAQGNHAVLESVNGLEIPAFEAGFPLLHLPVRSAEQLILKLNQGVEAYRRLGKGRDAAHGTHWDQMLQATADAEMGPELLNAVVVRYSEEKPKLEPMPLAALLGEGHRLTTFDLAGETPPAGPVQRRSLGEMLLRIHADGASEADAVNAAAVTRLCLRGKELRRDDADAGAEYAALPVVDAPPSPAVSVSSAMMALLTPGYRDIEDLVPSSKSEHIPFLFGLADVLRPRRFVEVGTLRGAGFLAVCQAIRQGGIPSEAIAISGWAGDVEAQADYRGAFETFSFLIRKYSDFAGYLRMRHEDAVHRFRDGSVDLLHLDGFREDVPLREAIRIWMPKLSSRGVLLLHDTHVHRQHFGVWRVWEDLEAQYPALNLSHAEGLGMVCVGQDVPREMVDLCGEARADRHLRMLLQQHFAEQGRLSAELFSRRYDMARSDARARAEGAMAEELSWLRQQAETLRAENAELRGMLKGGILHAGIG